jgi:mannose-6-phosphate isomerase-like protein (cupin superfamily)
MKKFDIDLSVINDLLLTKSYKHLGNISLDNEDVFKDIGEVVDFVNYFPKHNKEARAGLSMMEIHELHEDPKCPKLIIELAEYIKTFKPYDKRLNVVGFLGFENSIGYRWHSDEYHIIAMNIIGETTWYFRDGNEVKMKPGDLLFIPSPVEHQVDGSGERFTLGFCSLTSTYLKKYQNKMFTS